VVPLFQCLVPPHFPWAIATALVRQSNIGILTGETTKVKQRTFLTLKLVGKHVVFVRGKTKLNFIFTIFWDCFWLHGMFTNALIRLISI
jgi:hypothetical protein